MQSAYRYLGTYLALLRHFAVSRGRRFWFMLVAVLINAVLHPLPFLLLAELLRGASSGSGEIALGWQTYSIRLRPDLGVALVFLAGAGSYLISFAVGRLVNGETIAWQGRIFWQLMGGIGQIARWDRTLDFGVMLQPRPVATRIDAAVRGAFPIGRLIETGMRDAVMVLVLVSVLLWLDPRDMAVLGFLSLLFVPAYAAALSRLVRMQAKSNAGLARLRQPVISLLRSDVTRRAGRGLDPASITEASTEALSRGYGSQSLLLNEQNAVTVVGGVHVFAAFYGVYLSEGRSLMALPVGKLAFFFFLVLMLRSLISLVGLISRLSRGYERLGLLRSLLFPAAKPSLAPGAAPPLRFLVMPSTGAGERFVAPTIAAGATMAMLAPDMNFGFQLLPLSNALLPRFFAGDSAIAPLTAHIPLLREADMPVLLANGVLAGETEQLRLPGAGAVAIRPEPIDLSRTPVVALTIAAWERLMRQDAVAKANAGRVLVVAIAGWQIPPSLSGATLIAISNGRALTDVGSRSEIAEPLAKLAASAAVPRPEAEEEEELGT